MHVERLDLVAFGPFTDFQFDFGEQPAGLHVVFGANEAGKSSSLRGLKALLFGFDERTPDNHLHPNDKLRVAGCLRNVQGDSLELVRRKGRKNTLLSPLGDVLDDTVLLPYLGGISTEVFDTLFGIDHRALVQGGQDILEQKGDVGQALFAASLGTHTVHRVLQALEAEAAELFRSKGSTQTINALLKTHKDLQTDMRRIALQGSKWDEQRRAVDDIHAQQVTLDEQLRALQTRQHRLRRLERVIPLLATYDRVLDQLTGLGEVTVLPADFASRHRSVRQDLAAAQAASERARQAHQTLTTDLANVPADAALLGVQQTLDALQQDWPRYRQACNDVPVWKAASEQRQRELNKALLGFGLAESESALPIVEAVLRQRKPLLALVDRRALLSRERRAHEERHSELLLLVDKRRRALTELDTCRDSQPLRAALRRVRNAASLEPDLQRLARDLAAGEADCQRLLKRLALTDTPRATLSGLAVPRREQLVEHEKASTKLQQEQRELTQRERDVHAELSQLRIEQETLSGLGAVPTERELTALRGERDQHWTALRTGGWPGTEQKGNEAGTSSLDRYTLLVQRADELADTMRREADRIQRNVQLNARQESLLQRLADIQRQAEQASDLAERHAQAWSAMWQPSGIQPDSPALMLAWLDDWNKLLELIAQRDQIQVQRDALLREKAALCQSLHRALQELGLPVPDTDDLRVLADIAQDHYERLEQQAERRASLQQQLSELEADRDAVNRKLADCERATHACEEEWLQAVAATRWPGIIAPDHLQELLAGLAELQTSWHELEALAQRLQQAEQFIHAFTSQVQDVARGLLGSRWQQHTVDAQLEQLLFQLSQERGYQVKRDTLSEQLRRAEQDQLAARQHEAELQAALDMLCQEAGVSQPEQLEKAERDSREYERLQAELQRIQQDLLRESPGVPISELRTQAEQTDVDTLPGELASVAEALEDLDQQRQETQRAYGRAYKEFELLQGGETVAELAEQAQACVADIQQYSEQYVRCRVAVALLRHHIERFRQENQGPLVLRASEHFRQLTCGRYTHLKVDFSDRDEAVLMGVRENAALNVQGMSAGTRDQLYLSLRLAALERYLDAGEPLPFIVDDILIEFDDQRSLAALHSLARLAERTQVILFTHHARIVEQVKQVDGSVRLYAL